MARRYKPPIPQWIIDERKRLGWKPAEVSERLKALGYEAEESTVQVWESGRNPSAENIEGLERIFGSPAPREAQGAGDMAALIAAQTAVLSEIRDELRLSRLVSERSAHVLAELLGANAETLDPADTPDASDAHAPLGTAG